MKLLLLLILTSCAGQDVFNLEGLFPDSLRTKDSTPSSERSRLIRQLYLSCSIESINYQCVRYEHSSPHPNRMQPYYFWNAYCNKQYLQCLKRGVY